MFKKLYDVLKLILVQFSETNYMRLITAFAVILPLVLAMYTYLDTVIFDSKKALLNIASYSNEGFPVGSYFLAYLGVAQFDVCLTTIFTYITTAIVWSFTTDLQPAVVGGKKK